MDVTVRERGGAMLREVGLTSSGGLMRGYCHGRRRGVGLRAMMGVHGVRGSGVVRRD